MFEKSYAYVGPDELTALINPESKGIPIKDQLDVQKWIKETGQTIGYDNEVTATFVVKKDKKLYIGDRHSEHVACANGENVLSAGEITFALNKDIEVSSITNQSTGYCPEPKSWKYVAKALKKARLNPLNQFTTEFEFRRCANCDTINVIKDDWYVCAICDADLDKKWNLA